MKRIISLAMAFCMALSLASCSNSPGNDVSQPGSGTPGASSQPAASGPDYDRDITLVMSSDMVSFDPMASSDLINQNILNLVYDRLFEFDENLNPVPYLVKDYAWVTEDACQFTIYDNITFTTGEAMTTEDVLFSLNHAVESGFMSYITSIEAVDDTTFVVHCNGNAPALFINLASRYSYILPKDYYEQAISGNDWSTPVGSGRYTLKSRTSGDSVTLVRNDSYWNQADAALNASLTFKVIPEGANRTIQVETGEADANVNFATADYERVISNNRFKLWEHESSTIFYLGLDNQNQYLSNPKVRQAINYVLDRDSIILAGYNGLGIAQYSTLPPSGLGYMENPGNYSYDVEKAKSLMAEAGYADGFTVDLLAWNDSNEKIATVVQAYLSEINITANIQRIESSMMNQMAAAGQAPMWVASWGCYADPDSHLGSLFTRARLGTSNRFRLDDDWFEAKYLEGRTPDESTRIKVYQEIQQYFADNAIWAPLFVNKIFVLANAELQGVQLNTESPMNYHTLHY